MNGLAATASLPLISRGATLQANERLGSELLRRVRGLADQDTMLDILLPQGSQSNVDPVARAFTEATGVRIALHTVPVDDINSRLILAAATGQQYDVALPATFGIPDLVEAGALQPLDRYQVAIETDQASERSMFWLGDYYNDKLYGFQTDGDVYVMFYNREILHNPDMSARFARKFGYAPQPARTWQEVDRLMRFYHRPANNIYGGALFRTPEYIAWEYWIRLHSKGVLPFDSAMRPQLDTPGAVAAAEELAQASRYLTPGAQSANLFQNWRTFSAGNVLCNIGWGGSQKYFQSNRSHFSDGIIIAPTPGTDDGGGAAAFSYFNWGWNYAVPSSAQNPELAFLFARFAVMPEISTPAVRAPDGFFDPFQEQHYEDEEIIRLYGEEFLDVHRSSMQAAIPDLYLRGRTQYMAILSDYLLQVDAREIGPQAALAAVSQQWDELTNTLGRTEQIRQWQLLQQRYPPALQPLVAALR